jgi:hypothetical protein
MGRQTWLIPLLSKSQTAVNRCAEVLPQYPKPAPVSWSVAGIRLDLSAPRLGYLVIAIQSGHSEQVNKVSASLEGDYGVNTCSREYFHLIT